MRAKAVKNSILYCAFYSVDNYVGVVLAASIFGFQPNGAGSNPVAHTESQSGGIAQTVEHQTFNLVNGVQFPVPLL